MFYENNKFRGQKRRFLPAKSPSDIVLIRFSCISSFFKFSSKASAFCGTAVKSLPPRLSLFNFLKLQTIYQNTLESLYILLVF